MAPDCNKLFKIAACLFGKAADKIIMKWSVTQHLDLSKQLEMGIRFFDLRVAYNASCNDFQFVHEIYGPKIECCMHEINSFLEKHEKEVVILDFNHFYNVSLENHAKLLSLLSDIFGKKICSFIGATKLTLNVAWENNFQVVICYHVCFDVDQPIFWPGCTVDKLWRNTDKLPELMDALNAKYNDRYPRECFFNWQGVLTPKTCTVLLHLNDSLKSALAKKATAAVTHWIKDKSPSCKGLNIISVDFIHLNDFVHTVVKLNHNIK